MKGEVLFEKMTSISEAYITEAALVPAEGVIPARRKPFATLSRALNSGWGVACICFIVAIAAVAGMVAWGRMGDMTGPGEDPSVRFAFSYEMTANDGTAWSGTALPGDMVNVSTSIVNHGKPFDTYDFFAYARFVLQEDESVVIEGHYPLVDSDKHTIENGGTGSRSFHFHIPENATPGVYDLVLSYDGVQQVFSGVLTVEDPTGETESPEDTTDHYDFSFGYEPFGGFAILGNGITIETWVINEGASFVFKGSSMGFAPSAVLIHMETQYRIDGSFGMDEDYGTFTVNTGDKGQVTQEFFIPADAPTGAYALQLSYGGVTKSFEDVLTVRVTTDTEPLDENGLIQTAQNLLPYLVGEEAPHYRAVSPCSVNKGVADVRFYLYMRDIRTAQCLTVSLDITGAYLNHELNTSEYSAFLPRVTDDMIEVAKQDVIRQMQNNAPNMNSLKECGYSINEKKELLLWHEYYYLDDGEGIYTERFSTVLCPASAYSLTMSIGSDWLYEPIDEAYVPGEEVTVRIKFATDVGTLFFLNGEVMEATAGDDQLGYWEYTFEMPNTDSQIIFHTYDGAAPYAPMLEACILRNPYLFSEEMLNYYGEFGDGIMVAMMLGYGEAEWNTTVGEYTFHTPITHDMFVFHNGTLYEMTQAYRQGIVTDEHLPDIFSVHRSLFPDYYD